MNSESLDELTSMPEAMDDAHLVPAPLIGKLLGEGVSSNVFEYGQDLVIKIFREPVHFSPIEHYILTNVSHPNIIVSPGMTTCDVINSHGVKIKTLALIFNRALKTSRQAVNALDFSTKLSWFFQIAKTMEFLHEHNILHLDLKPDNILVQHSEERGYYPVICDFGGSFCLFGEQTSIRIKKLTTSPYVRAPELFYGTTVPCNKSCDVWALGITFIELWTGKFPPDLLSIHDTNILSRAYANQRKIDDFIDEVTKNYHMPSNLKILLERMLRVVSGERLTMQEVAQHPIFDLVRCEITGQFTNPFPSPPSLKGDLWQHCSIDHDLLDNLSEEITRTAVHIYHNLHEVPRFSELRKSLNFKKSSKEPQNPSESSESTESLKDLDEEALYCAMLFAYVCHGNLPTVLLRQMPMNFRKNLTTHIFRVVGQTYSIL